MKIGEILFISLFLISLQSSFVAYYLLTYLECKISKSSFFTVSFFSVFLSRLSFSSDGKTNAVYALPFFISIFLLTFVFFRDGLYKKIYHFAFLSCILLIQNEFLYELTKNKQISSETIYFFEIYCFTTILAFLFLWILRKIGHENTVILNKNEYILLLIFPIASIFILILSWKMKNHYELALGILLLLFNAVNFYLYNYLGKKNELLKRHEIIDMQNSFHSEFLKQQHELAILQHDLNNIFLSIEQSAANNDMESVMASIHKIQLNHLYSTKRYSGCFVIDSVLNNKINIMEKNSISYSMKLLIPSDLSLTNLDIDVCAILGNLLDNAIEEIQRKGEGSIEINLRYKDDKLIFQIMNSTTKNKTSTFGDTISSSKMRGRIGIGTSSIRERVNKHHGFTNFQIEDGIFKSLVVIPIGSKVK